MTSLLSAPVQKIARFLLKRVLGAYIKPHSLRSEQMEVQLLDGELRLTDVELEPSAINPHLAKYRVALVSGSVRRLRLAVPMRRLLTEKSRVFLEGVRLEVAPLPADEGGGDEGEKGFGASETVAVLTRLVQQILLNVEIFVDDLSVVSVLPLKGGTVTTRVSCREALALSPETLRKTLTVNDIVVEVSDHKLLVLPALKVAVELGGEQPEVHITLPSVTASLRSPDHVGFIDQLSRLDELLDDSAMFQSFVSEASTPRGDATVFWYEDADEDNILSSLKQRTIEVLDAEVLSSAVDVKLRVKPLVDLAIGQVTLTAAIEQVQDQELRVDLRDVKLADGRFELGDVTVAVVTLQPVQDRGAPVTQTNASMFLSAIDTSSSTRPQPLESPTGARTPSSVSAVSSPHGGVSTPGGSSVHTVQSLPEGGVYEEGGEHEYEGPFFQGTLLELVPRGSPTGEGRKVLETSAVLKGLRGVVFADNTLSIASDVSVALEASDLAFAITTAGYLTSRLNGREVQVASAVEPVRLPFTLDLQGKVEVILSCDGTRISLVIPNVAIFEDSMHLLNASFFQEAGNAKLVKLSFSKQSIPPPKPPRSASDSPARFPSTDPSEMDGWTEIPGKGQRRKPPSSPPLKKSSLSTSVTLKSRVHEAACFQVSVDVPALDVTCSGVQLLQLQIDLSTFADRFGAASIFYNQRIPVPVGRWAVASPVKAAVDVLVHEARLTDLVKVSDTAVRVVSFIEPLIGPVTQLGVSVREVALMDGQQRLSRSTLKTTPDDQSSGDSVRSRFDSLTSSNPSLRENVRLFMTPQPRKGQGMNTFVTLVYSIDVGGLELSVHPHVVKNFFINKLIPFFSPLNVPLLPRPAQLSAKAFTMYKLHVHDLTLRIHPDLALTLRGLDTASGSSYQFEGGPPVKLAGLTFKATALEAWVSTPGSAGEVLVAELLNVQGAVKLKEQITETELKLESFAVEVCADSLCRLKSLVEALRCDFETAFRTPPSPTVTGSGTSKKLPSVTSPSSTFTLEVDEDFVRSLAPSLGRQASASPKKPPLRQPQQEASSTAGEARWLVDPNSVSVLHDHVTVKTLPVEKPRMLKTLRSVGGEADEVPIVVRLQLTFGTGVLRLYDGEDWSSSRAQSRSVRAKKNVVSAEVGNGQVSLQSGVDQSKGCSVVSGTFRLGSVDIRDGVVASVYQFLLSRLDATKDTTSPQLSGGFVLASDSDGRRALSADVAVSPLCVTVDQDAAEFMARFLVKFSALEYLDEDSVSSHDPSAASDLDDRADLLIENLNISAVDLELNYRAKRVSIAGLRRGDPVEYLNLLPVLEGLQLRLSELRLADVGSLPELVRRVSATYMGDLNKSQIVKSLSSLTPIRSLKNILSKGLGQLISQPMSQMRRKDGRVSKGIAKGVHALFRTLIVESLALADAAVTGAHAALSSADAALMPRAAAPEPAIEVNWEGPEDAMLEWTPVERGASGQRPYMPDSPAETLEISSTALLRGIFSGIQGVRQAEGGNTVLSVARGLPLFVLRPAMGATEAISMAVKSARGVVDATRQKEQSRRFKAPFARGGNF